MKRTRTYAIASLAAAGSLLLSACSDNTASGSGSDGGSGEGSSIDCGSGDLVASGSSAQAKAIDKWQADFSGVCSDITVQYDPSGSGAGIKDFIAGQNIMAGSDSALKEEEQPEADARCESGPAIHLPMVISPIAITYNLEGVDDLTLNAEVIASIFGGEITTWNDPAIAALNDGVELPSTSISTVHRSKDSGTTDNLTKYLEAAGNGKWTFGTGKAWTAPGGQGAPDSAGIVAAVQSTDGSISYVDGPDAAANELATAKIDSGSGGVEISDESVGKAVAAAEHEGEGNDIKLSINHALQEEGAYPAVMVTYEIVCESGLDEEQTKIVKSFLQYAVTDGQESLSEIGYAPLPDELKSEVEAAVEAISAK